MANRLVNALYLPEAINLFNVYSNGNKYLGITDEVTLPEFSSKTVTMSGTGILGEIEAGIIGQFQSLKQEVPFRMLENDIFTLASPGQMHDLTFRGSMQSTVKSTGDMEARGIRIVERGRQIGFKPGTLKMGDQMGASVTLELVYIMIEISGENKLELDKLNGVYKVNGVDLMEQIRRQC